MIFAASKHIQLQILDKLYTHLSVLLAQSISTALIKWRKVLRPHDTRSVTPMQSDLSLIKQLY